MWTAVMVEEQAVIASFSGGLGGPLVQVVVSADSRLNASGAIPGGQINMRPWDGRDPQTLPKRPGAKCGEANNEATCTTSGEAFEWWTRSLGPIRTCATGRGGSPRTRPCWGARVARLRHKLIGGVVISNGSKLHVLHIARCHVGCEAKKTWLRTPPGL